jgi:hypothetical protein
MLVVKPGTKYFSGEILFAQKMAYFAKPFMHGLWFESEKDGFECFGVQETPSLCRVHRVR